MATAATQNLREKVEFPTNVPVTLTLDYDEPKLAPGRFGDQYQYVLDGGTRIMWVDPTVRDLITATRAKAGDAVVITKREQRKGTKRSVVWDVAKLEDEPAAAREPIAPPPPPAPPAPAPIAPAPAGRLAPVAQMPAPPAEEPEHAAYFHAFKLAIDTARDVEAYAAALGRPVAFTSEDLRAMAATLFMNGGRR